MENKKKGQENGSEKNARHVVAVVAALFMFSDIAAAMPIAPMNDDSGISPIFVRGGRGGGGARRLPRRRHGASMAAALAASTAASRAAGFIVAELSRRGLSWRRLSRRPCGCRRRTRRLGARLWLAGRRSNRSRRRRRLPDSGGRRGLRHHTGAGGWLVLVLQRRFTAFGFLGHLPVRTLFAAWTSCRSRFCGGCCVADLVSAGDGPGGARK